MCQDSPTHKFVMTVSLLLLVFSAKCPGRQEWRALLVSKTWDFHTDGTTSLLPTGPKGTICPPRTHRLSPTEAHALAWLLQHYWDSLGMIIPAQEGRKLWAGQLGHTSPFRVNNGPGLFYSVAQAQPCRANTVPGWSASAWPDLPSLPSLAQLSKPLTLLDLHLSSFGLQLKAKF